MEISGKVLREVEFRDRLRGYDTDEVDEFLEKVAVAVDEMTAELSRLGNRAQSSSAQTPSHVRPLDEAPQLDDDSIRRTLVLAQRTADLAVSEAREEAERIVGDARQQSEAMLSQAHEAVRRMRSDAEQELHARVSQLEGERDRLEREAVSLASLLEGERERLTQSLGAALRYVEETLAVPADLARAEGGRARGTSGSEAAGSDGEAADRSPAEGPWSPVDEPSPVGPGTSAMPTVVGIPDVESEITEDAATAARRDDSVSDVGTFGLPRTSPPPALDADEALWAKWASGGGLESSSDTREALASEMPLRFDRRPGGDRSA